MEEITITLTANEWELVYQALDFYAGKKRSFIKNHPEGEGCNWYKQMAHNALVFGNLADIVHSKLPNRVITHSQKMEMQAGEVEDD